MQNNETWDDRYDLMNHAYLRYGVTYVTTIPYVAGVDGPEAVLLVSASGGIITLPPAAEKRHAAFYIKNLATAIPGPILIQRSNADLIEGATSLALPLLYDSVLVVSDGVDNWWVIANAGPSF
jgi:hypothetical protein